MVTVSVPLSTVILNDLLTVVSPVSGVTRGQETVRWYVPVSLPIPISPSPSVL